MEYNSSLFVLYVAMSIILTLTVKNSYIAWSSVHITGGYNMRSKVNYLYTVISSICLLLGYMMTVNADEDQTPEQILEAMGYEEIYDLPSPPFGQYLNAIQIGKLVYVTTAGPEDVNGQFGKAGEFIRGRFGKDFSGDAQGALIGELSCLRMLRFLRTEIGELSRVKRIIKINANLLATPDYTDISPAVNGCSDFLVKVFGKERGLHARGVGGKTSLPFGIAMEIDAIVELM
jgi:hypothetical protein